MQHFFRLKQRISNLFSKYTKCLKTHPYTTQAATSTTLWFLGDILSQQFEKNEDGKHDWKRTARMTGYGFFIGGFFYSWWYTKILPSFSGSVYKRVMYDQLLAIPELFIFFTSTSFLEGLNWREIKARLRQEYIPTYATDCTVWPIVQFFNFKFVSKYYHNVVVNCVSLPYSAFLSYMGNKKVDIENVQPMKSNIPLIAQPAPHAPHAQHAHHATMQSESK